MAILSKGCKTSNFEPHNSLKLSFTNIWGLHSDFVEGESPNIHALCETNLDDLIDSDNFSVRCYLSLICKDSIYYLYAWSLSLKEGRRTSFCMGHRKLCRFSLFSISFTSLSVSLFLFWSPSSVIFFLSQMILLRWLIFLLWSLTVTLTVLLFWIYLFLLILVFVLQWLSLHWEILMLLSQFPLTFQSINSKQDAMFHHTAYDYFCADWDGLHDHFKDAPW